MKLYTLMFNYMYYVDDENKTTIEEIYTGEKMTKHVTISCIAYRVFTFFMSNNNRKQIC